jgi:uncharacterized protein
MLFTAFENDQIIAAGPLSIVAAALRNAMNAHPTAMCLVFDDDSGQTVELDVRGSEADVVQRVAHRDPSPAPHHDNVVAEATAQLTDSAGTPDATTSRGRGRPKLGVVAREVTLLPRHWDWLATQPGGASVALRRLVDQARRSHAEKDRQRAAHERAYRFMATMAGDRIGFEEASRALFANDQQRFESLVAAWPAAIAQYVTRLAFAVDNLPPTA